MKNLQQLREERADHAQAVRDLMAATQGKKWTTKNQSTYDASMSEMATLDGEMKRINDFNQAMADEGTTVNLAGNFNNSSNPAATIINVNGRAIPILNRDQKVSDFYPKQQGGYPAPGQVDALSSFVLANMGISGPQNAVTRGPAIIEETLAAMLIDAVRAQSVVHQAGGSTILIGGPSNITRISSDATVYEHTEGAEDVSDSTPIFEAVTTNPKALVALIPLSAEAVADSSNLDQVLFTSLAAAFAKKHDDLCLATLLADVNIPTSAVGEACDTWAGILGAIGSAMGVNQGLPGALLSNTADFIARASQVSTSGGWLGRPEALQTMLELSTSKITAGTAIFGDFAKSFATVIRQGLTLEVVRFAKSTSYTHLLVAHSRMAGYVLQPKGLYRQQQTVV